MNTRTVIKHYSGLRHLLTRTKYFFGKLFGSESLKRGRRNEKRGLSLTQELYRSGMIPHRHSDEPFMTKRFSALDRKGYDIMIPTSRGDIGIQIKSSKAGMDKFIQYRKGIPCIIVNDNRSDEDIKRVISRQVWKKFNQRKDRA